MTPSHFPARRIGGLALATSGVTLIGIVSIVLFFTVGGIFGTLNDLANVVEAILSAVLAWALYPVYHAHAPRLSRCTLITAWLGALIATIGSALIILDVTGWYLAGLYTMAGYALAGVWLFGLNHAALQSSLWPRRLAQLGQLTAVCMAIGFLSVPGILGGIDSVDTAMWFVSLGLLGSLGWLLLYPNLVVLVRSPAPITD